jgi:hypothetical protein
MNYQNSEENFDNPLFGNDDLDLKQYFVLPFRRNGDP